MSERHDDRRPVPAAFDARDESLVRRLEKSGGEDPRAAIERLDEDVDRAELEHVLALLEAAGRDERRIVAESEQGPAVLSEHEIRELARRAAPPVSGPPLRAWGTAAALLVLALAAGQLLGTDRTVGAPVRDPGPTLGSQLEAVRPVGAGSYDRFEWKGTLLPGGFYRVRILDAEASGTPEITTSDDLYEPSWTPRSTETWPESILWEVVVYDGDGLPSDSSRFAASRSRP